MKKENKKRKDRKAKFLSILLILVVIGIAYFFVKNLQTIKIPGNEYKLYEYINGDKIEYTGILEISNKKDITKMETTEGTIYLESNPIYFLEEVRKAILPADMEIAFPMENGRLAKVSSLSTVYEEYGDIFIRKGDVNKKLNDAFLYDGDDLYFFIENTKVSVNGEEYKLPPLSYVNATYKGYVEIYNYDKDEYIYVESVEDDVIATADKYKINLSNDTMQYEDVDQLLIKRIKNLPNIE